MVAVAADDENDIRLGLFNHLVEFIRHVGRNICGFGNLAFADGEAERVDIQHSDEFG